MKFNFKAQKYQIDAVNAVISVFRGQKKIEQELNYQCFTCGNSEFELSSDQVLSNIRTIQNANQINLSDNLIRDTGKYSLDISMETGTGKTYTYIRTIFELNKNYGWSKFLIVVPSIAIKEGTKNSLKDTQSHFYQEYGKKAKVYIYSSSNLSGIKNFALDNDINIMIINMQSFNRDLNKIYKEQDDFNSSKPIDKIAETRPIIILDEPQKTGKETQKSFKDFNPLFFLNYSATHKKCHNLVYELDALDAYKNNLVKRIEVKGITPQNLSGANFYAYLEKIEISKENPPLAKLEFEIKNKNQIKRKVRKLKQNDDLYDKSNNLESYKDVKILEINAKKKFILFSNGIKISEGEFIGSETEIKRIQIRETIKSHFEKEEKLYEKNIKVISLFFLDKVSNYRQYEENKKTLGKYGLMFEEEYEKTLNYYLANSNNTKYKKYLKKFGNDVSKVHDGYFSKDKKIKDKRREERKEQQAYHKILKDKEKLLSFSEPIRFIFSHSTLCEGWDNPNIFQICPLKESLNNIKRRQEVGRGMRICVNQNGTRMNEEICSDNFHDINTLTVISNESYESFVKNLQNEFAENYSDKNKIPNIKEIVDDEHKKTKIKINKKNKKEFEYIWNLIKTKYTYKTNIDIKNFIKTAAENIKKNLEVSKQYYQIETGRQTGKNFETRPQKYMIDQSKDTNHTTKYDLIKKIAENTELTRKTVYRILKNIGDKQIEKFKVNPSNFIKQICQLIKSTKLEFLKDNIYYKKTDKNYEISIFEKTNVNGEKLASGDKSLQDYTQIDSNIEKNFLDDLEKAQEVIVYAKLPLQFKIPTPQGNYTPDWAIICKKENKNKRIYFIVETKADPENLRVTEKYKTQFAEKLFGSAKTESKIKYNVCKDINEIYNLINQEFV